MLPFILGGVALAVTGYGIGKFLEEDEKENVDNQKVGLEVRKLLEANNLYPFNFIDKDSSTDLSDVIVRFEDTKSKLCKTTLKELQLALKEIKNLEKDFDISIYEANDNQCDSLILSDDIVNQIDKYIGILEDTQNFIPSELDKLDELIIKSSDYVFYSQEEKEFVKNLIDLNNMIVNVTSSKITADGETIARDVKRAFGKIEVALYK